MEFEFQTLTGTNIWKLVKLPEGRKVVTAKRFFGIKCDGSGSVSRYKVRLAAERSYQAYSIHQHKVISPGSRYAPVIMMVPFTGLFSRNLVLVDSKNPFMNAPLQEEIYADQPDGFVQNDRRDFVYVLRNA